MKIVKGYSSMAECSPCECMTEGEREREREGAREEGREGWVVYHASSLHSFPEI